MAKNPDDEIARQRDEVIKRMIATPPKTHKSDPKRRPTESRASGSFPSAVRRFQELREAALIELGEGGYGYTRWAATSPSSCFARICGRAGGRKGR